MSINPISRERFAAKSQMRTLVEEQEATKAKVVSLSRYLSQSAEFDELPKKDRDLLCEQFQHLCAYSRVLDQRVERAVTKLLEGQSQ